MKRFALGFGIAVLAIGAFVWLGKTPVTQTAPKRSFQTDFPKNIQLKPVSFNSLNGFEKDHLLEALPALEKSCSVLSTRYREWHEFCLRLNKIKFSSDEELRHFLEENMQPYSVNDGQTGLFTGYYEPEIRGSLEQTKEYATPVYGLPDDIVRIDLGRFDPRFKGEVLFGMHSGRDIKPYLTRKEIESGKVKFPAETLAWVKEPAELFILQIQGSGILQLPNGKRIGIGYAGNNGHAFVGIGSVMAQRGLLRDSLYTMAEIKDWLIANPEQAQQLMNENPRYIFFKRMKEIGAVGSLGVHLTAGRSLAVDPSYIPLGSFLWLQAPGPDGLALDRLMTAQDTGSAIKGPIRGDFFWGTGEAALKEAGRMKSKGIYFLLLPKPLEKQNGHSENA